MHFLVEYDDLLKNDNNIQDKISAHIKLEFDCKRAYNKNFFENQKKIKLDGHEAIDFHNKEVPKVDSNHPCLTVITIDSVCVEDGNIYPQAFLKECKCNKKKLLLKLQMTQRFILMTVMKKKLKLNIRIMSA